ncbi:GNAT family N-acetyltransferase [Gorillibacterium timonense]|uniref:GNAT family N-acetyltransferase n=1 Tax=Gorillibacterium timonense TaxID=1689269 RepID=UPI00071E2F96|nr:GNAT family N-acetyltransferase [Gorillibacterium timonense]
MTEAIQWKQVSARDEDLHRLIAMLDHYLQQIYPPDEIFLLDFSDPHIEDVTFLVAYLEETPVGCGAFKPLDHESAEIKRVFVDPEYRNRGIASGLIGELEQSALQQGYKLMRLETGEPQLEAVRLYQKLGYAFIPRYGEYQCCESSICMEKQL